MDCNNEEPFWRVCCLFNGELYCWARAATAAATDTAGFDPDDVVGVVVPFVPIKPLEFPFVLDAWLTDFNNCDDADVDDDDEEEDDDGEYKEFNACCIVLLALFVLEDVDADESIFKLLPIDEADGTPFVTPLPISAELPKTLFKLVLFVVNFCCCCCCNNWLFNRAAALFVALKAAAAWAAFCCCCCCCKAAWSAWIDTEVFWADDQFVPVDDGDNCCCVPGHVGFDQFWVLLAEDGEASLFVVAGWLLLLTIAAMAAVNNEDAGFVFELPVNKLANCCCKLLFALFKLQFSSRGANCCCITSVKFRPAKGGGAVCVCWLFNKLDNNRAAAAVVAAAAAFCTDGNCPLVVVKSSSLLLVLLLVVDGLVADKDDEDDDIALVELVDDVGDDDDVVVVVCCWSLLLSICAFLDEDDADEDVDDDDKDDVDTESLKSVSHFTEISFISFLNDKYKSALKPKYT